MPEPPEVEVVRRGLDDHVRGRTIVSAVIRHPRAVRRHVAGPEDLTARMIGATVTRTTRRGKYLWLVLDDRDALLTHLGMSGQMLITSPDAAIGPHERARLTFTDGGHDLRFDDQRTFGHLMYDEGGARTEVVRRIRVYGRHEIPRRTHSSRVDPVPCARPLEERSASAASHCR